MEKSIGLPSDRIKKLRKGLNWYHYVQELETQKAHRKDMATGSKAIKISKNDSWGFFDETQDSISYYFRDVLGDDVDINKYLSDRFPGKDNLILIEVGGPGYVLRTSMPQVSKSYAICLEDLDVHDYRSKISDPNSHIVIARANIDGVESPADLTRPETFRELNRRMNGEKADVLIERISGGWNFIYKNPEVLFHLLNKFYKLMSDNSVMLIQLIYEPKNDMERFSEFVERVNIKYQNKLKIKFFKVSQKSDQYSLLIEKFPGCPKELTSLRQNKTHQHEH